MSCEKCQQIKLSCSGNIFNPPDGYKSPPENTVYQCSECGQWWWCYNFELRLWDTVEDFFTLEVIRRRAPISVTVGNPSRAIWFGDKLPIPTGVGFCGDEVQEPKLTVVNGSAQIQWTGQFSLKGNRGHNVLGYQFRFPISARVEQWGYDPDSFQVVFLGRIRDISRDEDGNRFGGDMCVAKLKRDDAPDFCVGVERLLDPAVGVIEPRLFFVWGYS